MLLLSLLLLLLLLSLSSFSPTMSALSELVANQQWQVAITPIQSLAYRDAADQLLYQDKYGITAFMYACYRSAPLLGLELVQLMITKAKLDSRKRCLLAISANQWGGLHCAADPPFSSS